METIEKLNQISEENKLFCGFRSRELTNWSLEEQKQLLDIYYIISKKEHHILDLIYYHHRCDSWEDIFRDYDKNLLKDKAVGVKIAIDEITEKNNNLTSPGNLSPPTPSNPHQPNLTPGNLILPPAT